MRVILTDIVIFIKDNISGDELVDMTTLLGLSADLQNVQFGFRNDAC